MTSKITREFRDLLNALPTDVRRAAVKQFQFWQNEPTHPSVQFKPIADGTWSARFTRGYRALARRQQVDGAEVFTWYWIGPHGKYDRKVGA